MLSFLQSKRKRLLRASESGDLDQVKKLLGKNTNVNSEDDLRRTPLQLAAQNGHDDMVELLLKSGARINPKDVALLMKRYSLLDAASMGYGEVVKMLLMTGAPIDSTDMSGWTSLHWAVNNQHIHVVDVLLKANATIDAKNKISWTPLHLAASNGCSAMVKLLLERGAFVDAKTNNGYTPLHTAASRGHGEVVGLLLTYNANNDAKDEDGRTPLDVAAKHEQKKLVAQLLKAGATIDSKDFAGSSALLEASSYGHNDIVEMMLEAGSSVDTHNQEGSTSLHLAARHGHHTTLNLLINHGAAIDYKNKFGRTALHEASCAGHDQDVELLLKAGAAFGRAPIHEAACTGQLAVAKLLLKANATIDLQNEFESTPLQLAAFNGQHEMVDMLLKAGASVNARCKNGSTPLHDAACVGQKNIVALLLNAGAAVNSKNKDGHTAIYLAARNGHDEVVKVLLNVGGAVESMDANQWTLLHWAAYNGHFKLVDLLLKSGASVESKTINGSTPLHTAAFKAHETVVALILNAGSAVDSTNNNGRTALHLAASKGHDNIVHMLLTDGASLDLTDNDGRNAFQIAHDNSQTTTAEVIEAFAQSRNSYNPRSNVDLAASKNPSDKVVDKMHTISKAPVAFSAKATDSNRYKSPTKKKETISLSQAIYAGNIDVITQYLQSGVDANSVDVTGDSILHLAVRANREDVVLFMLGRAGIHADQRNKDGVTPLILAMQCGHTRLVECIYAFAHPSVPSSAIDIDYKHSLGAGGCGCVYKGTFNNEEVAVKTAHGGQESQLQQEISIMLKCRSPYIVDIVAISRQPNEPPKLALQYMNCGDLRMYLQARKAGSALSIEVTPLEVAWVVANALADLHGSNTLHRDLKSQNILLSTKHYIKLGDLGISREFTQNTMTQAGTPLWEAPEVLRGERYDYTADVYSFGVILTELDTLQLPYSDLGLNTWTIIDRVQQGLLRPSLSKTSQPWLKKLADMCLEFDPKNRPTGSYIVDMLQSQLYNPGTTTFSKKKTRIHYCESSSLSIGPTNVQVPHQHHPPSKWTRIPCQKCNTMNHIISNECIQCSTPMRSTSEMVALLLKRVSVAKAKGLYVTLHIDCPLCWTENDVETMYCVECQSAMSDNEKLTALVNWFESLS